MTVAHTPNEARRALASLGLSECIRMGYPPLNIIERLQALHLIVRDLHLCSNMFYNSILDSHIDATRKPIEIGYFHKFYLHLCFSYCNLQDCRPSRWEQHPQSQVGNFIQTNMKGWPEPYIRIWNSVLCRIYTYKYVVSSYSVYFRNGKVLRIIS
jgi:hypothetical protein